MNERTRMSVAGWCASVLPAQTPTVPTDTTTLSSVRHRLTSTLRTLARQ